MNTTKTIHDADASYSIGLVEDFLAIFAFLSTLTVSLLVRSYLHNIAKAKECLLLFLYKEVASCLPCIRFIWVAEVVLGNSNEFEASKLEATIVSLSIWFLVLYLGIMINLISFLKVYETKTGLIDPPMPMWMGENEKSAMKRIRFICGLTVVGFLSVCFGFGLYPNFYYTILKDTTTNPHLTTSNLLYRGPSILMLLIFVITSLVVMLHKTTNEPQIDIDTIIPRAVNFIAGTFALAFGLWTISEVLQFLDIEIQWKYHHILMSTILVFLPPALVLKSKQLKSHSARFFQAKYDDLFFLSIYFWPTVLSIVIYSSLYTLYQLIDV